MLRYNTITSDIAGKIGDEIRQHFTDLSDENKNDFIAEIFGNDENCNEIKEDHSKFGEKVQETNGVESLSDKLSGFLCKEYGVE